MIDKPIIFLDCDGVVNCMETFMRRKPGDPLYVTEPILVGRVQRLAEQFDARIVICSTWRKFHDRSQFATLFPSWLGERLHPIWRTPDTGFRRGYDIRKWFDEAYHKGYIDASVPYVILDDDSDFLPGQYHVKTDALSGISNEHVAQARKLLNEQIERGPLRKVRPRHEEKDKC